MSKKEKVKAVEEVKEELPTIKKLEDTITLGGSERKITRMKAGQYYECQKLFLQMIKSVQKKYTEVESKTVETQSVSYWDLMEELPEEMMAFVALCLGVEPKFIKEEAFPEEIPEAYGKIVALNDFTGNIKNFVTPIRESLGV